MTELERMLADSAERLFAGTSSLADTERMEQGQWPAQLWSALEQNGLIRLFVGEAEGGASATWAEGLPVLLAAARNLLPVPFIDTAVCAGLLSRLGLPVPDGPIALGLSRGGEVVAAGNSPTLSGSLTVPWGRYASHVLVRTTMAHDQQPLWALVPANLAAIDTDANIAGEARDRLRFDDAAPTHWAAADPLPSMRCPDALGALLSAIRIAGTLERVLDQTVAYAGERTQFGRPIAKFQAIQQQLAVLANAVVAARMATAAACAALPQPDWVWRAMAAKVICGRAAGQAAAIAHQVHGAIGFTYEHSLHFCTRRLWSWRAEYGSETHWAQQLGKHAIVHGGDALWNFVTDRKSL